MTNFVNPPPLPSAKKNNRIHKPQARDKFRNSPSPFCVDVINIWFHNKVTIYNPVHFFGDQLARLILKKSKNIEHNNICSHLLNPSRKNKTPTFAAYTYLIGKRSTHKGLQRVF